MNLLHVNSDRKMFLFISFFLYWDIRRDFSFIKTYLDLPFLCPEIRSLSSSLQISVFLSQKAEWFCMNLMNLGIISGFMFSQSGNIILSSENRYFVCHHATGIIFLWINFKTVKFTVSWCFLCPKIEKCNIYIWYKKGKIFISSQ